VTRPSRKLKLGYLELFSLAVIISLIVGVDLYILGINKRLSALESEFVEVKAWAFPASLLEGKYASLNARVRALTESFNGLDVKLALVTSQQQAFTVAAEVTGDEAMAVTEADIPSEAPAAGIAPESAETTGMVRRTDEETPVAASTPAESPPVVMPGESAGDNTVAPNLAEEASVEERPSRHSLRRDAADIQRVGVTPRWCCITERVWSRPPAQNLPCRLPLPRPTRICRRVVARRVPG
jgi:hypothetical protein